MIIMTIYTVGIDVLKITVSLWGCVPMALRLWRNLNCYRKLGKKSILLNESTMTLVCLSRTHLFRVLHFNDDINLPLIMLRAWICTSN